MLKSILDTDLYKLTMQQAVCDLYPRAEARYKFINRDIIWFPRGFDDVLRKELGKMKELTLTKEEKNFLLEKCPYLSPAYIDFLSGYQFNPDEVKITQVERSLRVTIEGPWYRTILWEVPLMAMISELYFKLSGEDQKFLPRAERQKINYQKADLFRASSLYYAEFGGRRRASSENQREVVMDLKERGGEFFRGTSNVYFAMKYDLTPVGTQAHEWFQFHAAKYGFREANSAALGRWVDVYHGDLGIALSDTFGSDAFFKSFDVMYAKLFDGVRHDSGDPFIFLEKVIKHYESLRINPLTKTIVFSDSLNPELAVKIHKACKGRILDSYGIGTNLTNDVGVTPLNIVIKMVAAKPDQNWDWIPAVKLSDVSGKHTGDKDTIIQCKKELGIA